MTSIDVYIALDTWVPATVSAVLMITVAIAVIVADVRKKHVPRFFVEMLQLNFPDIEAKDVKHRGVQMEDRALNPTAIFILSFCVLPLTLGSMFVTFWNVFLVAEEVRGDCVPNYDCYPLHDGRLLQRTPVQNSAETFTVSKDFDFAVMDKDANLSSLFLADLNTTSGVLDLDGRAGEEIEDVRYECYRFVFLYAQGISAAGGVLLFTALFSKLYFSVLIALLGVKRRRLFRRVMIGLVWVAMGAVFVVFVAVNTAVPRVRRDMFQTVTSIIQFLMYTLNLFIIVVSGVVITFGILYNKC